MPKTLSAILLLLAATAALAHVTPSVEVVKKGQFLQEALPDAAHFFERQIALGPEAAANLYRMTGWQPSSEDAKVYVGRDSQGKLVGRAILLWLPSQHGPVGIAVVFDTAGRIRRAAVTDAGSEPFEWLRPLLDQGLTAFNGLAPGTRLEASEIAPQVKGAMSRYYAGIIADGVRRAQALEEALRGPQP